MLKKVAIASSLIIFLLYVALILSLLYFYKGSIFFETITSERVIFSIKISIITATIVTCISLIISVPAAYALSRYDFWGKSLIDTSLELPMVISPAALGALLLIFFNNPFGEWIQSNIAQFVFTTNGIILAQFVTTVGISTRLIKATIDEIPQRYEEVAQSLGVSPIKVFFTITLPLARKGLLASAILTWAKAIGEFGATITIAGSMAMKTETLPIAIFMKLSTADIERTVVLILILLSIGLFTLYAVRTLMKGDT
ncbi:MAG: ABC transporter permease [Calditerrivibrio sp.]|nr:ABC transporter permease [Calditerrivibrio sp.]